MCWLSRPFSIHFCTIFWAVSQVHAFLARLGKEISAKPSSYCILWGILPEIYAQTEPASVVTNTVDKPNCYNYHTVIPSFGLQYSLEYSLWGGHYLKYTCPSSVPHQLLFLIMKGGKTNDMVTRICHDDLPSDVASSKVGKVSIGPLFLIKKCAL